MQGRGFQLRIRKKFQIAKKQRPKFAGKERRLREERRRG